MREPTVGLGEPPKPPKIKSENLAAPQRQQQQAVQEKAASRSILFPFVFIITLIAITVSCGIAGFLFGDSFGRENAQFNNPELRDHYIGQCLDQVKGEFRRELKDSLNRVASIDSAKVGENPSYTQELLTIRTNLNSIKEALMHGQKNDQNTGLNERTRYQISQLLNLLESRHVELVSDRCPASSQLPRKYSRKG